MEQLWETGMTGKETAEFRAVHIGLGTEGRDGTPLGWLSFAPGNILFKILSVVLLQTEDCTGSPNRR